MQPFNLGRAGARGPPPPKSLTGRPFLNGRGHCGEATLEESREQTSFKTFQSLCENLIGPGELRRSYVGRVAGRTPSVLVWAFRSALFVSWRPLRATWVPLGSLVGSLGATWEPRGASWGRSWGPLRRLGGFLGPLGATWVPLGGLVGPLGMTWVPLGSLLGISWEYLGLSWGSE